MLLARRLVLAMVCGGASGEMRELGLWVGGKRDRQFPVRFSGPSVMEAFGRRGRDLTRIRMEIVEAGGDGR